jgi:hypothetical protein
MSRKDAHNAGTVLISSRFAASSTNFMTHVSRNVDLEHIMISLITHANIAILCVSLAQGKDQINAKYAIKLLKLDNFIS